ncbi:MAG: hypothetical protein H5T46_05980 [Archaeoglobi archaeon]|nr:hypothetical protein [Candidatus Mnemosynella sp.]
MTTRLLITRRQKYQKRLGISRTTLLKIWKTLEDLGIVVETRRVGRAKMYRLNRKNPIVQKFIELDNAISEYYAKRFAEIAAKA